MIQTVNSNRGRRAGRGPRPRGVRVLAICAAIFAGVLPIISAVVIFAARNQLATSGTVPTSLLSAALGVGIVGAAVATWRGSNTGRIVLLALVVTFYVLLAWSNWTAASSSVPEAIQRRSMFTAGRSLLWVLLYLWYFLRPTTVAWYRQP